ALLARAVELARPEHVAFTGLPFGDATRLVASVARLFGSMTLRAAAENFIEDDEVQANHDEVVKAALSLNLPTPLHHAPPNPPPPSTSPLPGPRAPARPIGRRCCSTATPPRSPSSAPRAASPRRT